MANDTLLLCLWALPPSLRADRKMTSNGSLTHAAEMTRQRRMYLGKKSKSNLKKLKRIKQKRNNDKITSKHGQTTATVLKTVSRLSQSVITLLVYLRHLASNTPHSSTKM